LRAFCAVACGYRENGGNLTLTGRAAAVDWEVTQERDRMNPNYRPCAGEVFRILRPAPESTSTRAAIWVHGV
jgi:hypothetical protein